MATISQKQQQEINFNRIYSRFKVQVFFKNRSAITHYGQERYHCTVAQILFGHVTQVILEQDRGLQDCIDRIKLCEKWYGQISTALIYDRTQKTVLKNGTVQQGKEIRKYIGTELAECEEIHFTETDRKVIRNVEKAESGKMALVPVK